jgi:murein DD-endopeptidase MepM/ murein hydrolase activator NlpD
VRVCLVFGLIVLFLLTGCGSARFSPESFQKFRFDPYRTRPNQTVGEIAEGFGIPAGVLAAVNGLSKDHEFSGGEEIKVPFFEEVYPIKRTRSDPNLETILFSRGEVMWPVLGGGISSPFGRRWGKLHAGVDIRAPQGTPVFASHDGEVVYSGDSLNGYGNAIIIKGRTLRTLYGHNRQNLVEVGEYVKKGDLIAAVGATGHATGPHVHFETRLTLFQEEQLIDPLILFERPFPSLDDEYRLTALP